MTTPTFNVLMYSHDTYGLGHIRRTLAIANNLVNHHPNVNVLILTGSPIVGRFDFKEGIDFVRIPGMIKKSNDLYLPHSIRVEAKHAMSIRREIIAATARSFSPALFIVDKAPLGLKREVCRTLKWFKRHRPCTQVVLGLRDIMDDAESTIKDWKKKKIYKVLEELYDEVWVYGDREMYDPIKEYSIPASIQSKMFFTGYIPRRIPRESHRTKLRRDQRIGTREKLVVVTTGGGGDGHRLLDNYLTMLEQQPAPLYRSIIITGPLIPEKLYDSMAARARQAGVRIYKFFRKIEKTLDAADLVVSMGGYNTICELLTLHKRALIIPRETPRKEQLIRAQVMHSRGLLDYIRWTEISPELLRMKISSMLNNGSSYEHNIENFPMTAFDVINSRIEEFQCQK